MTRLDGTVGFDLVKGIGRSRPEPERPEDPNQLAKMIVDIATGEIEEPLKKGSE